MNLATWIKSGLVKKEKKWNGQKNKRGSPALYVPKSIWIMFYSAHAVEIT